MMPNKTYALRNLVMQENHDSRGYRTSAPLVLNWPVSNYLDSFHIDAEALQKAITPSESTEDYTLAKQVFGSQKQQQSLDLQHLSNLFYERCRLHNTHIRDIEHRHLQIQEKKFGVEINHFPDRGKRLSGLENQLLQLEQERRHEELAFWKDTVDLREKMFETAHSYKQVSQRYHIFSDVEAGYGH